MADYSKILDIRDKKLDSGDILPDSLLNDIKKFPALTDEMAAESLLVKYPYEFPGVESEEVTLPTLAAMFSLIKELKDDPENMKNGRKAWQKFVDGFPKKAADWKKKIVADKRFGERGWKTFYDLWKQASTDKMYMDIAKARRNVTEGWDEKGNFEPPSGPWPSQWGTIGRWPASAIMGLFAPRTKEAIAQGRDPKLSEYVMDVVGDLAYAAPMGGAEAAAARAIGNPFWRKAIGATAGAAIAPVGVTTLDYLLGTKDFSGIGDAAIDAGIGTATNLGVGKALAPGLSALANLGSVKGRLPAWLTELLEGSKFKTSKARDLIDDTHKALDKHFTTSNADVIAALENGKPTGRLTDKELIDALDIKTFADDLKANSPWIQEFRENWKKETTKDLLENGKPLAVFRDVRDPWIHPKMDANGNVLKYSPEGDMVMWNDPLAAQRHQSDLPTMLRNALPESKLVDQTRMEDILASAEKYILDNGGPEAATLVRALENHPELLSLVYDEGLLKDPAFIKDAFRTFVLNKSGNDAAAGRILSRWGIDPAELRKMQDESRKEEKIRSTVSTILEADELAADRALAKVQQRQAPDTVQTSSSFGPGSASSMAASDVISGETPTRLSPESQKYLKQISVDPSIMIYGHPDPDERDRFNMWLLTEGNSLLRGTPAARPTWEVK